MKYKIYKRNSGFDKTDRVVNLTAVQTLGFKHKVDKRTAKLILNALSNEVGDGLYYMKEIDDEEYNEDDY